MFAYFIAQMRDKKEIKGFIMIVLIYIVVGYFIICFFFKVDIISHHIRIQLRYNRKCDDRIYTFLSYNEKL